MDKTINRTIVIEKAKKFYEYIKIQGFNVEQMYLFGSYVKNTNREDSDIDLAIILKSPVVDIIDTHMKLMRIAGRFDDCLVEPYPFDENIFMDGNPLAEEVKKTGIRII